MSRTVGPNSLHGVATYNGGCRCWSCRQAHSQRARRERKKARQALSMEQAPFVCAVCGLRYMTSRGMNVHRTKEHDY